MPLLLSFQPFRNQGSAKSKNEVIDFSLLFGKGFLFKTPLNQKSPERGFFDENLKDFILSFLQHR